MKGQAQTTLVLGGTGKTGRRIVERLTARGLPTRVGSRSGEPPFDWDDRSTWAPALHGVGSVYISYYPDIAVPGAVETVGSFAELAVASGVPRLVLLSGRGEPEAEHAEQAVLDSGAELTILRSTWFSQNFSESYFVDSCSTASSRFRPATPGSRSSTPTTSPTSRSPRSPTPACRPALRAHRPAPAELRRGRGGDRRRRPAARSATCRCRWMPSRRH